MLEGFVRYNLPGMTQGMPGFTFSKMDNKKAIVFVDGNNWYHNVKTVFRKPRVVDIRKLARLACDKFGLDLVEVRYYNSIPDIEMGEENYYKHMVFLAGLERKRVIVNTRKLKGECKS